MSRHFLVVAGVILFAVSFAQAKDKSPNIVFVLADDLGIGDPRCYNADSRIPTPHIDRVASEGIRFTDAHSPSAVCTPTRYGILTGRYCWRTELKRGVTNGRDPLLVETDRLTVPKLLARHGYATAAIGKWHLGFGNQKPVDYTRPLTPGPLDVGFNSFYGIPASLDMPPYLFVENDRAVGELTEQASASKSQRLGGKGFWRDGLMTKDFRHIDVMPMLTARAVKTIEDHAAKKREQPLFLYFALTSPHDPWLATMPQFAGKSGVGPRGDAVMQTDWALGQVLDALDRAKLADDTLVIFTSDNGAHWFAADEQRWGPHRASGPWRGQKSDIHEGGHRVPLVARWPGKIKPDTTTDELACLADLLGTCSEIVGEKLPDNAGEDSHSLLPTLLGTATPDKPARGPLVLHSGQGLFALRDGDWKLINGLGSGGFTDPKTLPAQPNGPAGQLYNLREDPAEQKNVYLDHPEIVTRMRTTLEQYKQSGRSRLN